MLSTRPWRIEDAEFVCEMRNDPDLMQWYRQSAPISLEDQRKFITKTSGPLIIELDKKPIGVLWIKKSEELSLVLRPKHFKYIPQLLKNKKCWGDIFIRNPMLRYLLDAGFTVEGTALVSKDGLLAAGLRIEK